MLVIQMYAVKYYETPVFKPKNKNVDKKICALYSLSKLLHFQKYIYSFIRKASSIASTEN